MSFRNWKTKPNIDALNIYELLESKKIDTVVTYDEILAVCLRKEQESVIRGSIASAIKKLRNDGIIYHNIRTIGYKRVTSSEIVKRSPHHINCAKRRLIIGKKEIEAVDDTKISNEEKIKKNTMYAVAGLMLHLSKPNQTKRIQQRIMNNSLSFNPNDNLKYLSKS